ncbi:MAG: family 16 glycosylhydrolase [Prevotellaceae bacterium]|jgi:beta-glucanase (GH16 family)|nr:family 16 glycosylhydrolase [Prevotellaceae bacterium]
MKKTILLFLPFWIMCFGLYAQNSDTWELIFQDDFNGTAVNQSQWGMYYSAGHAGNGLRRPEAYTVSDGILTVTAQMIDGQLVSGGMAHQLNVTYGKFEVRVRADDDSSKATSAVLLTWPQSERWPIDGENDFYETTTNRRESFHTYIHYGADNNQYHKDHKFNVKEWRVVTMEWEAEWIKIYVDGELQWTLTDKNAIPDVPHHLCIQLDAFKKTMTGSTRMQVDWVKIYRRSVSSGYNQISANEASVASVSRSANGHASVQVSDKVKGYLKLEVYDISGRLLHTPYEGTAIPDSFTLPFLGSGIHVLKAYTHNGVYSQKF